MCDSCVAKAEEEEKKRMAIQEAEIQKARIARCREMSGMTAREYTKTFNSFETNASNATAVELAKTVLRKGNLVILGKYGVGKTHLGLAMANAWCDAGTPVKFCSVGMLLYETRASIEKGINEMDIVAKLRRNPLIIDDFGSSKLTEWSLAFMDFLVDEWYRHESQGLVLTTNIMPSKIAEIMSGRIASRLNEMAQFVELSGKDRRALA